MNSNHDGFDRFEGDGRLRGRGGGRGGGGGCFAGPGGDEVRLRREVQANEDAIVFGAPTGREGGEVELLGGREEREGVVVLAGGGGDDGLYKSIPSHPHTTSSSQKKNIHPQITSILCAYIRSVKRGERRDLQHP